jgi:hypothetical protein
MQALPAAAGRSTSDGTAAQPDRRQWEVVKMNEDRFNMDIRKFLKVVGVTSQREIEKAVRDALAKGVLKDETMVMARVTLSLPEIGLQHVVEGEIGIA